MKDWITKTNEKKLFFLSAKMILKGQREKVSPLVPDPRTYACVCVCLFACVSVCVCVCLCVYVIERECVCVKESVFCAPTSFADFPPSDLNPGIEQKVVNNKTWWWRFHDLSAFLLLLLLLLLLTKTTMWYTFLFWS